MHKFFSGARFIAGFSNFARVLHKNYNHFHNILRLFDVLLNFPFATSETMAIITYKHGIYELPHELAERLKTLGN